MDMNFTKAHHFSINGGNFGTVNGGVNNYTLTPGSLATPAQLGIGPIATGLLSLPPSQGNNAGSAAIHSVPSTPASSNVDVWSANSTPSPTSTTSTVSSGSQYTLPSRMSSATPATSINVEEPRLPGSHPSRPQQTQEPDVNLLTPLTDTLGLRRFTPGSQAATLSPYQTPQQATAEFPGSPQSMSQVLPPLLPPQHPQTPQPNNQVPVLPSTSQPAHNTHFLGNNSPSPLTPHPVDFPAYRTLSASPNGYDAGTPLTRISPTSPYPQNSPPPFDSSPMSPRTVTMPHDTADPEDPSVIFERLRAGTKGYASPLPYSNVFEYTPSPRSARTSLPRQVEAPQVNQAPQLAAPQSSQHWTPSIITDWTNHVHPSDSNIMPAHNYRNQSVPQCRNSRPLPSPPVSQPQVPVNSFSLPQQQLPRHAIHSDVYHAPPFHQAQYQDQPWPFFAPAMHPPHSFPPQHYYTHPNRLPYNEPQSAYHTVTNYGNTTSFPMPLMG